MPTININLKPCASPGLCAQHPYGKTGHMLTCSAAPVHIPCPIPRSVTFTVRLGECTCGRNSLHREIAGCAPGCGTIRVSCSIVGKTWEESEVMIASVSDLQDENAVMPLQALNACRDLWAVVWALLTGLSTTPGLSYRPELVAQRDVVFAALVKTARAEQDAFQGQEEGVKAMGLPTYLPHNFHRAEPEHRPSADMLARYVDHLVEQVGILGMEP